MEEGYEDERGERRTSRIEPDMIVLVSNNLPKVPPIRPDCSNTRSARSTLSNNKTPLAIADRTNSARRHYRVIKDRPPPSRIFHVVLGRNLQ
jgi:hypothetical protein